MGSFRDLARHFDALPPDTVAALTSIAEAKGRAELHRQQNPAGLETLRKVALIQSTEASNAIEGIRAPLARIEALVAEKTAPQTRSEQEIAGYIASQVDVTVLEIAQHALHIETQRLSTADRNRITAVLEGLGWRRGTRIGSRRPWVPPRRNSSP